MNLSQTQNDMLVEKTEELSFDSIWFKGSLDEALYASKKNRKPLFLYWGAVWCPPCNELKSQVFSHPEFPQLMQSFNAVYLDGDQESAQNWGERLQISGYPTILVLSPEGRESLRISGTLSFDEFKSAIEGAITSQEDLKSLFQRVANRKLTETDWTRLAYLSWDQIPENRFSQNDIWQIQYDLIQQMPDALPSPLRVSLQSSFLILSYRLRHDDITGATIAKLFQEGAFQNTLKNILNDRQKYFAARQLLIFNFESIALWLGSQDQNLIPQWLGALDALSEHEGLSLDAKLWLVYPFLQYEKSQQGPNLSAFIPSDRLKLKIQKAVKHADENANSTFDRHAVISGAAYLLRLANDWGGAKSLLLKEVSQTDTPWYYYSSLSNLEDARGNSQEALRYSELAKRTAAGRATKIQWITTDLLLNLKLQNDRNQDQIEALTKEFYDFALSLSDGFMGRNGRRATQIAERMKPVLPQNKKLKDLISSYHSRCAQLNGENRLQCEQHFKGLL